MRKSASAPECRACTAWTLKLPEAGSQRESNAEMVFGALSHSSRTRAAAPHPPKVSLTKEGLAIPLECPGEEAQPEQLESRSYVHVRMLRH